MTFESYNRSASRAPECTIFSTCSEQGYFGETLTAIYSNYRIGFGVRKLAVCTGLLAFATSQLNLKLGESKGAGEQL
jgi:hypothetical protein